jgi:single-strand DNA-binding protein
VAIDGKLQIRSYDDRDGIRRTVAEVVAWRVIFLQRLRQQPSAGIEEEVSFDDAGNDIGTISIDEEDSMNLEEPNGPERDA